ncbi:hypothetical protein TanjilG_24995 [Lupinus angustifolius]|uniref:Uncharacterized protein n=1 Tax=Lupinus angustifolius TaxID=3871 RepID=A0A1J7IC74_LUPAN|nr:hypothetical protein TanjilG_24995 [Lupinus angustifolius]
MLSSNSLLFEYAAPSIQLATEMQVGIGLASSSSQVKRPCHFQDTHITSWVLLGGPICEYNNNQILVSLGEVGYMDLMIP